MAERPRMPNGALYHSPRGLYPFQADCMVQAYANHGLIGVLDTGLGKTHVAMVLAATLFERGEIDLAILVGRRNKMARREFPAEWARFTTLSTMVYHGPSRKKRLAKFGLPDVLMTTYETAAAELMTRVKVGKRGKGSRTEGPLIQELGLHNKRILWIFDEITKLKSRSAERYQAFDYALSQLRRGPHQQWVLGLTATPMSTSYEQAFNLARLVRPDAMPSIGEFESKFSRGRDDYGNLVFRAGMDAEFARLFQSVIFRKRETDADVRAVMPKLVEKAIWVDLNSEHRKLYDAVAKLYGSEMEELPIEQQDALRMALRLTAGHPASHLHSGSVLSRSIVEAVGEQTLRSIPSSKSQRLIEEFETLVRGQGAQVIVFTHYARVILPELVADLRAAGYTVGVYGGGQTPTQSAAEMQAFQEGRYQILVSTDEGAEGLNVPEASYVIEYEAAGTFDTRMQRFGRHKRLTTAHPFVFGLTMVVEDTVEEGTFNSVMRRNAAQDKLIGDTGAEGHLDAYARKAQLTEGKSQ